MQFSNDCVSFKFPVTSEQISTIQAHRLALNGCNIIEDQVSSNIQCFDRRWKVTKEDCTIKWIWVEVCTAQSQELPSSYLHLCIDLLSTQMGTTTTSTRATSSFYIPCLKVLTWISTLITNCRQSISFSDITMWIKLSCPTIRQSGQNFTESQANKAQQKTGLNLSMINWLNTEMQDLLQLSSLLQWVDNSYILLS